MNQNISHTEKIKNFFGILLKIRSRVNFKGKKGMYFFAVISGILAALIALLFHGATQFIQGMLTFSEGGRIVETFISIDPWKRIFSLTAGGILAGLILLFVNRKINSKDTPYMEVISIGNGYIPVRANLMRSLAAITTIASGASIGREGPLLQTASVFASIVGRRIKFSIPRLRLLIACAASGAMSAVFHTPLAGGLFVCEIVIGVMSMDMLAPLLLASCSSYITITLLGDTSPLYEISNAHLSAGGYVVFYSILLGLLSSLLAKLWLILLSKSRQIFRGSSFWLPARLGLAGLIVGIIAIWIPEVAGNGAHIIRGIIAMNFSPGEISIILALKIFAVALFFGMGAVGGVLTPSLTIGGVGGFLFAHILISFGVPLSTEEIIGFSLLGMASFFTTSAAAPITSIILVIEFTMAGRMIFPLIIGVLVSYGISKITHTKSMYSSEVSKSSFSSFSKSLKDVKIKDMFRKSHDTVSPNTLFKDIARKFLKNPDESIYVVSESNCYIGAIFQKDILNFLKVENVYKNAIADDIMLTDVPILTPETSIVDAIKVFSENETYETLPIVDSFSKFYGVVNKSDIFIGFNEIATRNRIRD